MAGSDLFAKADSPAETKATPTITAGTYSSGQAIGSKITFSPAVSPSGEGYLQKVTVVDRNQQEADLDIFFFGEDIDSTTVTDQSAFALDSADDEKVSGTVRVDSTDYVQDSNNSYATVEIDLNIDGDDARIYAVVVSRGAPTFSATDDLTVKLNSTY